MNEYLGLVDKKFNIYRFKELYRLNESLGINYLEEIISVDWQRIIIEVEFLSERFLEHFIKEITPYIDVVCQFQILTESFMRKYKKIIDWKVVSGLQKMSLNFLIENIDKIDPDYLENNSFIDRYTRDNFLKARRLIK
jgi:hypothetical protein